MLCEDCLYTIMDNLKQEEIQILNVLKKDKTLSKHLSIDKTKIMPQVKGLTEFKFNMAVARLEVIGLINRNAQVRPNKFYITKTGQKFLTLYMETLQKLAAESKEVK